MQIRNYALAVAAIGLSACTSQLGGVPGGTGGFGPGGPGSIDQTTLDYFQQTIGDRVFFEVDQSNLSLAAMATLDAQAVWLSENPELPVLIEGHADEQGTREYNLALGARRANAVRAYLVSKGIPDSRIRVVTYGKERPVAVCSDESCWSQNRRAVTVVSGPAAS